MDAVYAHLDRSESFAGRARLYDRLRSPDGPLGGLRRFDAVVTTFERDAGVREQVQSVFASLDEHGQASVLEVLFGPLPAPHPWRSAFPVIGALTLASLVASVAFPAARALLFFLAVTSIAVRIAHGRRGLGAIQGLPQDARAPRRRQRRSPTIRQRRARAGAGGRPRRDPESGSRVSGARRRGSSSTRCAPAKRWRSSSRT